MPSKKQVSSISVSDHDRDQEITIINILLSLREFLVV